MRISDEIVVSVLTVGLLVTVFYMLEGLKYKDICERLCIANGTLKTHMRSIFKKTGLHSVSDVTKDIARGVDHYLSDEWR